MWVTPEKGQLVMIADICWEQDVHTIGYNNRMIDKKNLKPMGFLQTEQCYKTYKVTYDPSQSTQWSGTDWELSPRIRCIAPNGTHWLCDGLGCPQDGQGGVLQVWPLPMETSCQQYKSL